MHERADRLAAYEQLGTSIDCSVAQFTAATDRASGEVTRVDVTLNVVK